MGLQSSKYHLGGMTKYELCNANAAMGNMPPRARYMESDLQKHGFEYVLKRKPRTTPGRAE